MTHSGVARRPGRARLGDVVGFGLALLLVGAALLLHHAVGPEPFERDPRWMDPGALWIAELARDLFAPLGGDLRIALAVLVGPLAALALAVFALTRSPLSRTLALAATIAAALFVFYGLRAEIVWRFFHWRWSLVMALFALLVAGALLAPLWAERWRRLRPAGQLASYLPVFFALVWLERDITGTDPTLRFALSPWPMLQIFALEVVASAIAAGLLGVAAGLALLERARRLPVAGGVALALLALAVALGFPALSLAVGSSQGLLPFRAAGGIFAVSALGGALGLAGARLLPGREGRARRFAAGALLLGLPLLTGQLLTRWDYHVTRDVRAAMLVEALDADWESEGVYPDALDELVERGHLDAVPRPRIGFGLPRRSEFTYQNFGESFLLEFSAPRWIQCAFSPRLHFDGDEDDAEFAGSDEASEADESADEDAHVTEMLGGSWSCPVRPPELW